jgi:deoxyribodipyrimidine photolyase-related protein
MPSPRKRDTTESTTSHGRKATHASVGGILAVVLGDQLDAESPALQGLDPTRDSVVMMEVLEESTHVPSHVQRTAIFLSAMRHFAGELTQRGFKVWYSTLDDQANTHTLTGEVQRAAAALRPGLVRIVEPGEHRIARMVDAWEGLLGVPVEVLEDTHFLTTDAIFQAWAKGRKSLTMEYFYREQRERLDLLMERDPRGKKQPVSGQWNYDKENREPLGEGTKPQIPRPIRFEPDAITRDVIGMVKRILPRNPGRLDEFGWPVTRADALRALDDFIEHRLPLFGPYEDAMWTGEPFLFHAALSPMLNLRLLNPGDCVQAAIRAYERDAAPLQSVEAFVRQLIGWREFIRGVYRLEGPSYESRNFLAQHGKLPHFFWTGETDMACMNACLGQVLDHGYGHHIQRLMVTGNFALLAGVHPREVSDWYLAMYVDGVDWVTLPNALGMVMHADGVAGVKPPVVGTKPYVSTGQYIKRMSNYCSHCRYDPGERTGDTACPFTTLYWDFLHRNRAYVERNPRMGPVIKNLDRFGESHVQQITVSARSLRERWGVGDITTPREPTTDHRASNYAAPPRPQASEGVPRARAHAGKNTRGKASSADGGLFRPG